MSCRKMSIVRWSKFAETCELDGGRNHCASVIAFFLMCVLQAIRRCDRRQRGISSSRRERSIDLRKCLNPECAEDRRVARRVSRIGRPFASASLLWGAGFPQLVPPPTLSSIEKSFVFTLYVILPPRKVLRSPPLTSNLLSTAGFFSVPVSTTSDLSSL